MNDNYVKGYNAGHTAPKSINVTVYGENRYRATVTVAGQVIGTFAMTEDGARSVCDRYINV